MKLVISALAVTLLIIMYLQNNSFADERVKFSKSGLEIDGEPVLSMCAEFHYWRTDPKLWDDILGRILKGARLKMVASYIPWSFHEPKKGVFDFTAGQIHAQI